MCSISLKRNTILGLTSAIGAYFAHCYTVLCILSCMKFNDYYKEREGVCIIAYICQVQYNSGGEGGHTKIHAMQEKQICNIGKKINSQ